MRWRHGSPQPLRPPGTPKHDPASPGMSRSWIICSAEVSLRPIRPKPGSNSPSIPPRRHAPPRPIWSAAMRPTCRNHAKYQGEAIDTLEMIEARERVERACKELGPLAPVTIHACICNQNLPLLGARMVNSTGMPFVSCGLLICTCHTLLDAALWTCRGSRSCILIIPRHPERPRAAARP